MRYIICHCIPTYVIVFSDLQILREFVGSFRLPRQVQLTSFCKTAQHTGGAATRTPHKCALSSQGYSARAAGIWVLEYLGTYSG